MILQVNQATANGRNQFEILENGQLLFRGSAPFYNPGIPIGGDVFRKLTLTDALNRPILYTDYNAVENLAASAVPMSWLFKGAKQVCRYSVLNGEDQIVGRFYFEQTGIAKTKYVMEWRGRLIACYLKRAGKKEVVSFYDGETQIGQLTKPNAVVNNLDCYLLHFLDNSLDREIAAFFTIYYDYLYHNHSGEIVKKSRRSDVEYTFDRYNKMYNKNFIAENFGKEENERVERFIKDAYKAHKKR